MVNPDMAAAGYETIEVTKLRQNNTAVYHRAPPRSRTHVLLAGFGSEIAAIP
jgi:hypothetical protein